MKVDSISEDDLFKAIEASLLEDRLPGLEPGTTTTPRVMERFKISRPKAKRYLNKLIAEGLIMPDKITNTDIWGNVQTITGFRWVEKEDK